MASTNSNTNDTQGEEEQNINDEWQRLRAQLNKNRIRPSELPPRAQHIQQYMPQRIPHRTPQRYPILQDFAQSYLQLIADDHIRWQEGSKPWRIPRGHHKHPPLRRICTHRDCGKIFDRDFQLANHVKYDHPDPSVGYIIQYKCKECWSNFRSVPELNIHQKSRVCRYCGKDFRCEQVLVRNNHDCGFEPYFDR